MKAWHLENVVETARENPESFFIPSDKARSSQKKGQLVRLHFTLDNPKKEEPRAERMWVEITQEKSFLRGYKGLLTNRPHFIHDLNIAEEIDFGPEHIAQIIIGKNDPLWVDSGELSALVSKLVWKKGSVIRFIYREKPDRAEDSGWRMFTGLETPEYNDNPDNIAIMNVSYLIDKDSTLLDPLKEGKPGSVYERKDRDQLWQVVTDWNPQK